MDEEQLKETLENLVSNQVFTGFCAIAPRFITTDSDGGLTYNKSAHLMIFKSITEAYNELSENETLSDEIETITQNEG